MIVEQWKVWVKIVYVLNWKSLILWSWIMFSHCASISKAIHGRIIQ
jgi:hypothetical protein